MNGSATAPELLRVSNLTISVKRPTFTFLAVHNASFTLQSGETLALIGESGSGKTLTSMAILDLLPSGCRRITGEVKFKCADEAPSRKDLRGKHISMVFQQPHSALNPVFRIGTQIGDILKRHLKLGSKGATQRCLALLEQVGFPDPAEIYASYPHELSGGMAQRAMIAMALSCDPKLIIADEPTSSLDVTTQYEILHLIKALQKRHQFALLLITHDLSLVRHYADNLVVMHGGRIVERGMVASVLTQPRHSHTKQLMASTFYWPPERHKTQLYDEPALS